jgi:ABC-2 type transport system ATP-binding protein
VKCLNAELLNVTLALEAVALRKRYGRTWALSDFSVSLPVGRVAALVGPNGAGKSTLLQLAVGLLRPSAGDIRVMGWSPRAHPQQVLPRVGFLAQDVPLFRGFSIADMLEVGRRLNPRWDQATATTRLQRLGISLSRSVGHLSGGQRAQVALAIALAKRPEFLLLDEPLASLDPLARHEFLKELMEAASTDGLTVLLSSHVIADLERVCDHLLLVNAGRLQVAGEIDDLMARHALLVGPQVQPDVVIPGVEVIKSLRNIRQTSLWVRAQRDDFRVPPGWQSRDLSLEEIVVAYLGNPDANAFPAPSLEGIAG